MENYTIVGTEISNDYAGFNFAVIKIVEDFNGNVERNTHFFNQEQKARDKFLTFIIRESKKITENLYRAGYVTENIVEIEAFTDDEILDAYGTFDTDSGNIITQVLLMKNPVQKAG